MKRFSVRRRHSVAAFFILLGTVATVSFITIHLQASAAATSVSSTAPGARLKPFPGYVIPGTAQHFDATSTPALEVISFDEALRQTNAFTADYGITIQLASCTAQTGPMRPSCLSEAEQNSYGTKSSLESIAVALADQPVSLPKAIGWKTIILSGPIATESTYSYGIGGYALGSDQITLDVTKPVAPTSVTHEESHLLAYRTANLATQAGVRSFTALNIRSHYANTYNVMAKFFDDQPQVLSGLQGTSSTLANVRATSEEYSRYALVSEQEDIAETGSLVIAGAARELYDAGSPVLAAKTDNFVRRIALIDPAAAAYWSQAYRR